MPVDPRLPMRNRRNFEGSTTTLAVGEEGVKYKVHEALLSKRSHFFASATKEEWKEGREHRVPLPSDTPSVIDLYVQWIYTGRIICLGDPGEEREEDEQSKNAHEFNLLIGSFVFGEKVQDGDFKDAVIDALIHTVAMQDELGTRWYPTGKWTTQAYSGTLEGSPIRRLLVDFYVFHGGEQNVDFLGDLVRRLLADRKADGKRDQRQDPTRLGARSCQYHHHSEGDGCYGDKIPGHVSGGGGVRASGAFNF